jgi:hypothetical protein
MSIYSPSAKCTEFHIFENELSQYFAVYELCLCGLYQYDKKAVDLNYISIFTSVCLDNKFIHISTFV